MTAQSGIQIDLVAMRADPRFAHLDGQGMAVVVIDTGADLDHPFFGPDADNNGVADRIVYQYDFNGTNDPDGSDDDNHGSNVASIVGSQDTTLAGVAPGANLVILRALHAVPGGRATGSTSDIREAMQWVVNNGAAYNVVSVNLSLGAPDSNFNTPTPSYISGEAAALATRDIAVVAAAGNDFQSAAVNRQPGVSDIAADANIWAVGAVTDPVGVSTPETLTGFSQRSPALTDILAPGSAITGANQSGGTVTMSGTSQAAPHIAGIVALAQQLATEIDNGNRMDTGLMLQLMRQTAVPIFDPITNATYWRVDVDGLMNAIYNHYNWPTAGADVLRGANGIDDLDGGAGADQVYGRDGGDRLTGGAGDDLLDGGPGADTLRGGGDNDTYYIDSPDDMVIENPDEGFDWVRVQFRTPYRLPAHVENATLQLSGGHLIGNALFNRLDGNSTDNVLDGGGGGEYDTMTGLGGNDTYYVDNVLDGIIETPFGGTADRAIVSVSDYLLPDHVDIADLTVTTGALLVGNDAANRLNGNIGDDALYGGSGDDDLFGGNGDDQLDGAQGRDAMFGGAGNDIYYVDRRDEFVIEAEGEGDKDEIVTYVGGYTLPGEVEYGRIGVPDDLTLTGNLLDNHLFGHAGDDTLRGGFGNDTLAGGAGRDTLDGGDGDRDWASYAEAPSYLGAGLLGVQVDLAREQSYRGVNGFLGFSWAPEDTLISIESAEGSLFDDILIGNGGTNRLAGLAGNDQLDGGAGADTAVFSGSRANYRVSRLPNGDVEVADLRNGSPEGTDTLRDVENLAFANGTFSLAAMLNEAPTFTAFATGGQSFLFPGASAAVAGVPENSTAVATVAAVDPDNDPLAYSIAGGADAGLFQIDAASGALSFIAAPDFEAPADADRNNSYEVAVRASDGSLFDDRSITVEVTDMGGVNLIGDGNVTLTGTPENDGFRYRSGFATIDGAAGSDILDFSAFGSALWVSFSYNGPEVWTRDRSNLAGGTWRSIGEVSNVEHLIGTAFDDLLRGNGSDNIFFYTGGLDTVDGLAGTDTIDFSRFGSAVWVNLASNGHEAWTRDNAAVTSGTWREIADLTGFEVVIGSNFADDLRGDANSNRLVGGDGNDLLNGRAGNDILDGGDGTDTAVFNNAFASYGFGLAGSDIVVTGEGTDTVHDDVEQFRFTDRTLTRAQVLAELAPPVFTDNADAVALPRSGGTFDALGGNDTVRYTNGSVSLEGGAGADTFDFSLFGSAVWVDLTFTNTPNEAWTQDSTNLTGGTWRQIADISNVENLVGTVHSDKLWGDDNDNVFFYTGGLDRFDGRGGIDTADFSLFGSAVWVDLAYTGTANEAWTRDRANVTTGTWRAIADLNNIENVTGTQHADLLHGSSGANRLEGGAGNDTLTGRGGNDTFVFRSGFGQDAITDFTGNGAGAGDVVELSLGAAFDTFAEVIGAGSQVGSNVVFDFGGGNTLTLNNVTLGNLHQNDFLFA